MSDTPDVSLSNKDKGMIALQAALMGIPFVGSSLNHFIFGPLTELRFRRIEETLSEVAEKLGPDRAGIVVTEQFSTLLESVLPNLSRAFDEEKRLRFRDLLINAARIDEDSGEWEEANLAGRLLREIETPGLAIVAAVARCEGEEQLTLTSRPSSQVFRGEFDYDNPAGPDQSLPYDWVVVEYWARWLRERRLISYSSHDARGGFGNVSIPELGRFLVKWIIRHDTNDA